TARTAAERRPGGRCGKDAGAGERAVDRRRAQLAVAGPGVVAVALAGDGRAALPRPAVEAEPARADEHLAQLGERVAVGVEAAAGGQEAEEVPERLGQVGRAAAAGERAPVPQRRPPEAVERGAEPGA